MKKSLKIVCIVVAVILVISAFGMTLAWSGILTKKADNDNNAFRILQVTDVHIRNDKRDNRVFTMIDTMIKKSTPDLIVVTGDISSNKDNESDFRKFGNFIEQYGIDWTFTFGNHDAEGNWSKAQISDYLNSLEHCVFDKGYVVEENENDSYTESSTGNYYQIIKNKDGKDVMALFYMDSNMYFKDMDGYANFRDEQIAWYRDSVNAISTSNNGNVMPSLAFFHIPLEEYGVAYKEGKKLNGVKLEKIYCSQKPDQMFETMVELGSTKGVFVGHDHMNNFTSDYQGIKLTYGYSADHTLYAVPQKGGNIINIKNDGSFTIQGIFRNTGIGAPIITKAF